jgi:hypothetical protein
VKQIAGDIGNVTEKASAGNISTHIIHALVK